MKRTITLLVLLTCWSLPAASQEPGGKTGYQAAFEELHQMLKGDRPIDFKRAVFITENAYLSQRLDYEKDFAVPINRLVRLVKMVAATDGLDYNYKDREQVLLAASIFRVMKDSLVFENPDGSLSYSKAPYTYDMDDFWGERDWANMFVVKLLYDQTGNCHSLPALYKILADELGTPAYLAIAPNHTYIKQWSDKTGWYNTELTTGRFPSDADIKLNSYIKTEAIVAGVFMDTLSARENIAYTVTDLAQGYVRRFGYGDASTPLCWLDTALQYYPDYVNALILKAELQKKQYEKLMKEKGAATFNKLWKDPAMKKRFAGLEQAYVNVHQTGYRRMPEQMYRNWQARVQKDTTGKIHRFAAPQPFRQYNYHVEVATGGDGQNYEFFDQEETVRIGTVEMNPLTGRITKFITTGAGEFPDGVVSRMYDPALGRFWQVDPHADRYVSMSPYAFAACNPIRYTDPDGQDAIDIVLGFVDGTVSTFSFGLLGNGNNPMVRSQSDYQNGKSIGSGFSTAISLLQGLSGGGTSAPEVAPGGTSLVIKAPAASTIAPNAVVNSDETKKPEPKSGSSGGPGAGKEFSQKTKKEVNQESNSTCVFCGDKTTKEPGAKRTNIDHADPKSKGGNNTKENAQNTCQTCNQEKKTKTTTEYLEYRKNKNPQ